MGNLVLNLHDITGNAVLSCSSLREAVGCEPYQMEICNPYIIQHARFFQGRLILKSFGNDKKQKKITGKLRDVVPQGPSKSPHYNR